MNKKITLLASAFLITSMAFCQIPNIIPSYESTTNTFTFDEIGNTSDQVSKPMDLDFQPITGNLWTINYGTVNSGGSTVKFTNPGQPGQTSLWQQDGNAWHFMSLPTGMAFSPTGDWANSTGVFDANHNGTDFTGPSLWSSDPNIYAQPSGGNGSHLDMLHESPYCMGIASEAANKFWVFDAYSNDIVMYDFVIDHGPGNSDHDDGIVLRYPEVAVDWINATIACHLVLDRNTNWLYIVDGGNARILRLDITSGTVGGVPSFAQNETLAQYANVTGVTWEVVVNTGLVQPAGIDVVGDRLIVSDYSTGDLVFYDINATLPTTETGRLATSTGPGIQGIVVGPSGRIWYANSTQDKIMKIEPDTIITANTANDDAGISSITTPTGTYCSGIITPVVVLRNSGQNALTSVTINYSIDGAPQTPYAWTGNLALGQTATVSLPNINATPGAHTFDANTTQPNGTTDQVPGNDAATQTNFTVVGNGANLPFSEGFEGTYLPNGWTANNNDNSTTWAKTTVAAKTGSASAFMDYFNYNSSKGLYDDIITPVLNLSSVSTPELTFEVAYSMYTDPNSATPFSDTLEVLISTDCGATWTSIYLKHSAALATATPNFTTAQFIPTANQWRKETVNISSYASSTAAMIMFRGIGDYENQMYIDDINIDNGIATGINNTSFDENVNIFPNPTSDVINVFLTSAENTEITILNIIGEVVYNNTNALQINKIDLSEHSNGIYFVNVRSGDQVTTKKVVLAK